MINSLQPTTMTMNEPTSDLIVVMTTVETFAEAEEISRQLVEARLVACAQILPLITSIYYWEGRLERSPEHLVLLKTRQSAWPSLEERLSRIHPYKTPEIVALPAAAVSATYLQWALAAVDSL